MKKLKRIIKTLVFSNKITASIYYKLLYRDQISNDFLIERIKHIAHMFDHRLLSGNSAKKKEIYEIEYLIDIAVEREIKFDDSLMWALSLYSLAKYNAVNSYELKTKDGEIIKYNSNLSEVIRTRRSVRKWKNEMINIHLIKSLIKVSLWAPSSCNRQPVRVVILNDKQKEFIRNYFYGTFWHKAPVQLLILCNVSAYGKTEAHYSYLDSGAFIQNLLLLFHEAGLGACWLGFRKWNVNRDIFCDNSEYRSFYEFFKIGEDYIPISMVVAGKYEVFPKAPARQSIDTVILRD